jgi:hypothetical protein
MQGIRYLLFEALLSDHATQDLSHINKLLLFIRMNIPYYQ